MWSSRELVVAHFVNRYFELSENWIHKQVKHLEKWSPFVVANATANLDSVSWTPPYFARWETMRGPLRRLDDRLVERFQFAPSHYLATLWSRARLIHAHFGPMGVDAIPLARALDLPLVTTFYGYDLSKLPKEDPAWIDRYQELFAEGACFLVEGPYMARQLAELGCPRSKIRVHHLGIEIERYPFVARDAIAQTGLNVLMVGRFVEKKGFPDGVEAFASFIKQGGKGELTIVGDDSPYEENNSFRPILENIVSSHGIEEHVRFRGFIPFEELTAAYYRHHVLLAPSRTAASGDNEGGAPVSIIEAQASGMPVVATRHCDIPEVVQHESTGLLVREGDVEALTQHLVRLYRDPVSVQTMGRSAHERMRAHYDARVLGRSLDSIYDEICQAE